MLKHGKTIGNTHVDIYMHIISASQQKWLLALTRQKLSMYTAVFFFTRFS